jgi:hypothetical protein
MKNLFRKIFFGDAVITEYSTITVNGGIKEKVYLQTEKTFTDVSDNQFLLCLEPVVFGVWLENKTHFITDGKYKMYLKTSAGKKNNKEKTVAVITLGFFDKIEEDNKVLVLLKLKNTKIYHPNPLSTNLLYYRYYKKQTLSFNKLKSFAAAYSYPRKVRIISFKEEDYFNIFPMDLVGDISQDDRYVFGLRHTNVTLSKIIQSKKIVVSEVSYQYKEVIYQLGKHHGSTPPTLDSLPFKTLQSEKFEFNIPEWIFSYKIKEPGGNLFHIHFLLYLYQKKLADTYPLV